MTTISDAWQAGIDAVVADNTLNRGGFVDALQTVITVRFSNAEGNAYCDAVAAEFQRLGLINNPTYNNLRNNIINDPVLHRSIFDALTGLQGIPEAVPANNALRLINLRAERDNVDAALARYDVLIAAEPNGIVGRLVKDGMRDAKRGLREYKQRVREEIQSITGDPDS